MSEKLHKNIWIQGAVNGPAATSGDPHGLRCFLYKEKKDFGKRRKLIPLKVLHFRDQNGKILVSLKFKRNKDQNKLIGWNEAFGNLEIKDGKGSFTILPPSKPKKK